MSQPGMTVVYFTSNGDYPVLEEEVRATIARNAAGLSIVSVSQKPIDFGRNICIGPIGRSRMNLMMQLRIAAQVAETASVAVCEADMLYPPEFFQFRPPRRDTYYYPRQSYILFAHQPKIYYRKALQQFTGIIDRKHLLEIMPILQDHDADDPKIHVQSFIRTISNTETCDLGPIVTFKTDRQMHHKSPHIKTRQKTTLPVWGPASELWETYRLS